LFFIFYIWEYRRIQMSKEHSLIVACLLVWLAYLNSSLA
jgi:hypothetical protein